jgi:hypothetical protein
LRTFLSKYVIPIITSTMSSSSKEPSSKANFSSFSEQGAEKRKLSSPVADACSAAATFSLTPIPPRLDASQRERACQGKCDALLSASQISGWYGKRTDGYLDLREVGRNGFSMGRIHVGRRTLGWVSPRGSSACSRPRGVGAPQHKELGAQPL